jgi:hypothetical protein
VNIRGGEENKLSEPHLIGGADIHKLRTNLLFPQLKKPPHQTIILLCFALGQETGLQHIDFLISSCHSFAPSSLLPCTTPYSLFSCSTARVFNSVCARIFRKSILDILEAMAAAQAIKSIGVPTLDKPFGIEVWPLFEEIWTKFRSFPPQDFRFVPGKTPMSTLKETAIVLTAYYTIILGGRELMRKREPLKLNGLFKVHNLGLTMLSFALFVLFVEQLLPTIARNGIFYAICSADGGWTHRLVTLYYVRNQHAPRSCSC